MENKVELIKFESFWGIIQEKLQNWIEMGVEHVPNFIVAILVLFVFAIMARVVAYGMTKVFRRSMESKQIADLLVSILKLFVIGLGIFIALELLGLKGTVTSLLAGAGVIGLALGFAFQDMTENLIAGIAMGIRKPFRIGDIISADDVFGEVKAINLRNTIIETFSGQMEIVPNKILFRNILTNFSRYKRRRIDIPVGISYADDPEEARTTIIEAINQFDFVIQKDLTEVYADGFGDSSINLLVWFWIAYPGDETGYMKARHSAIVTIKRELEKADILIPFPIRTLEFNAKGGTKLESIVSERFGEENKFKSDQSTDAKEQSE